MNKIKNIIKSSTFCWFVWFFAGICSNKEVTLSVMAAIICSYILIKDDLYDFFNPIKPEKKCTNCKCFKG